MKGVESHLTLLMLSLILLTSTPPFSNHRRHRRHHHNTLVVGVIASSHRVESYASSKKVRIRDALMKPGISHAQTNEAILQASA